MLTAVAGEQSWRWPDVAGMSSRFSKFASVLFCFVLVCNKSLNDWSLGKRWILFSSNLNVSWDEVDGNIEIRGKQNSPFPSGPVIREFWHQRRERQRQCHKLRIWLVECGKTIVLHVRHALVNKSVPSSAKQRREVTKFTVLMNTWAYNR